MARLVTLARPTGCTPRTGFPHLAIARADKRRPQPCATAAVPLLQPHGFRIFIGAMSSGGRVLRRPSVPQELCRGESPFSFKAVCDSGHGRTTSDIRAAMILLQRDNPLRIAPAVEFGDVAPSSHVARYRAGFPRFGCCVSDADGGNARRQGGDGGMCREPTERIQRRDYPFDCLRSGVGVIKTMPFSLRGSASNALA